MIYSRNIELFKNLSQLDYGKEYYDFHNDFNCVRMLLEEGSFTLFFKGNNDDFLLKFRFNKVEIIKILFFNVEDVENLTIDNIYRGRTVLNGELVDFSKDGRGYFYLEFYEGQMMEFWADSITLDKTSGDTDDSSL